MKDYSNFSATDLAQDEDFIKWVFPDADEKRDENFDKSLRSWLAQYPDKFDLVEDARRIVLAIYNEEQYHLHDSKQQALWSRIDESIESNKGTHSRKLIWYAVAASVTIALISSLTLTNWFGTKNFHSIGDTEYIVFSNNGNRPHSVALEDGSVVILQGNSTIRYPETFSQTERNVYLTGEAFFDVTKDPEKPFSVFANNVVTRVLGTSFNVRAYDDETDVVVAVKTGKVSVFQKSKTNSKADSLQYLNGVLLTPNQQITVSKKELRMVKAIVEQPIVVDSTLKENFLFSDTPIREVFKRLEIAYGVKIVYEEEALSNCFLNTSLKEVPFYDQLRMICKGINAEFEMVDANVIVKGGGCD